MWYFIKWLFADLSGPFAGQDGGKKRLDVNHLFINEKKVVFKRDE